MTHSYKNRLVSLEISTLSKKGHGVGTSERQGGSLWKIEVPFTLPGDHVNASLIRKQGSTFSSKLLDITTPSVDRISPKCLHFGSCGGCTWQQWPYEKQLEEKEQRIAKDFQPFLPTAQLYPILPCSPHWNYRNKMEFSFSSNAAKDRFLGLMLQGSRGKVFNLTECHLTSPWVAHTLAAVRQWWEQSGLEAYHLHRNTGSLRTLTLREGHHTGDRLALLTVSGNPDYALRPSHLRDFVTCLQDICTPPQGQLSIFLRIHQCIAGQPTQFYEIHLQGPDHITEILHLPNGRGKMEPLTFKISPTAFFQPNTKQAEKLYARALEMAAPKADSVVYDLYCGTGTLGLAAAKQCKQVVGIELSPEAVLDAKENAQLNQCDNITFLQGDVGEVLQKIGIEKILPSPDLVMVDPPRAGLDTKALQHLIQLGASTIAYVSCNPTTQAANIQMLTAHQYRLESLQPVDQFPHTPHIENIAILKKR